jgi:hypothetical protein
MAALVVCALCALVLIKPQEFIAPLAAVPLLYLTFAAAVVAIARDLLHRRLRLALAPQIPFFLAFLGWALLVTAVKAPVTLPVEAVSLGVLVCVFLAVAVGMGSSFGLRAFGAMFLGCAVLVSVVAAVQGQGPWGCFVGEPDDWDGRGELAFDGRSCESVYECRKNAPLPGGNYRCERMGPLNTTTLGGRVRYRGSLADPNELSLMIAMAVPFAFAMAEGRRARKVPAVPPPLPAEEPSVPRPPSLLPPLVSDGLLRGAGAALRAIPTAAVIAGMGFVVVLTRSRSGLIAFLIVLGIPLIRAIGPWGVVAGCLLGPPMILFGGRSGAEADSSTDERTELLREAFELIRGTKGIGVGAGQFTELSSIGLTAHNAYVLAAAEAGLVGVALFGLAVYASIKVPFAIWFGPYRVGRTIARLAPAIAVSLSGAVAGILFLSWTYKDVFYMLTGASAALYAAARARDPTVRVRVSPREAAIVVGGMHVLLLVVYVATRLHR